MSQNGQEFDCKRIKFHLNDPVLITSDIHNDRRHILHRTRLIELAVIAVKAPKHTSFIYV